MKIIHVNQVNENIEIQFRIMNGAQPFNVPEGVSCTIRGTKGDNFGYAAAVAVTAGSNVVTVTLTEQLTAVAGAGNIFELVFVGASDDMKVSTENFILAVERAALGEDTVISDSDLAYADQVLDQLQSVGAVNAQVQQNKANIAAEITRATAAEQTLQSNINAEASSRATTDASLQSQINQLVAPSGSAPSAAEVENARIGSDGTVYPTLGDAIRTQNSLLKNALNNVGEYAINTIVKEIRYPLLPFEIGAINITTSGWTYVNDSKRIRTPEGKEIWLDVGDVISLTDYTNARFFLGVRQEDGTYLTASWKTADFTVAYKGWYVLLVARINNEVALSSVAELADLVRITKVSTLQEVVQSDTKKIASIGTGIIPLLKNLTDAEVPFERGTITINDPPTTITYANSDRGIRIPESVGGIPLKAGDTIGLTDYSAAKYQLFYYANGTYVSLSTNVADKVVPIDGVYYVIINELNNGIISDVSEYSSLFFVNRISSIVETMEDSLSYIQYPYDIYPIHGINHRGMQYEAPENTLPAFRLSVSAGYHFVETDVQFTSDNVPVLLHDPTLNRTARNADGTALSETVYIKDITYAEALEYDFPVVNGVYDSSFAGTKIMKFEDFIIFCKRTELFPYLELKSETTYTQAQVNILITILDQYKMLRNVSWISWADAFLEMIVKADKGARVGRIKNSTIDGAAVNALNKFKTGFNRVFWSFSPYENDTWKLTEQSIINAKNAGQGLSIGVISTKAGMLNVLNHFENSGYISGCLSNERVNFAEVVKDIALGID